VCNPADGTPARLAAAFTARKQVLASSGLPAEAREDRIGIAPLDVARRGNSTAPGQAGVRLPPALPSGAVLQPPLPSETRFSRGFGSAPGRNRTSARGLGNRCNPNSDENILDTLVQELYGQHELLLEAFGSRLSRTKRPGTRTKYVAHVRHFLTWLGDRDVVSVRAADINDYLDAWCAADNPAPSTQRVRLGALKSFYEYLRSRDLLVGPDGHELVNPVDRVEKPKLRRRPNDWLRDDEDRAVLDAPLTEQERIVIWLLRWTGLRIGEACALRIEDVDFDREEIRVRESKSDAGLRVVPIVPELNVELRKWIATLRRRGLDRSDGPLLATGRGTPMKPQFAWRLVKRVAHRADVRATPTGSAISPHTLRRTFGSYLLNRGVRMEVVSKLLGHADTRVTQAAYAQLLDETIRAEVRRAIA
jgi:integrase/recombinase XerC